MVKKTEICLVMMLLLSSYLCTITKTDNKSEHDLASYDLDAHLIKSKLDGIKKEKLNCFYRQGVNDQSFDFCCGENYKKVENSFVNQYRILLQQLEDSFNSRIASACKSNHEPCEVLAAEFSDCIRYDRDLYQNIHAKKKEVEAQNIIEKNVLDTAFNRFDRNYKALMNARVLISNEMVNTVKEIQNFIKNSKLDINYNYMDFKPDFIYDQSSDGNLTIDSNYLKAIKTGDNDFNSVFLAEAEAKKMINYYILNGYVKEADLDKTKMPSEQLKTVKQIISAAEQKLQF